MGSEKAMATELKVVEGIMGTYHYHLAKGDLRISLCGAPVMPTSIKLKDWGVKTLDGRIREHYCKKCEEASREG